MCCYDASQIVNSENPTYEADTGKALKDLTMNLRNMIFMQKLKGDNYKYYRSREHCPALLWQLLWAGQHYGAIRL
jgi:hypothetical protein